ncbi:MAG: universal stress protein [Bacteroidota bacterium]
MTSATATLIGMPNSKYRLLRAELQKVIEEVPFSVALQEVNDVDKILAYSVASIPAVIFNNRIIFENGHTPQKEELVEHIFEEYSKDLAMDTIVVPIDFSQNSLEAFLFAQELAAEMGSSLQLVHFTTLQIDPYLLQVKGIDDLLNQSKKYLNQFVAEHRFLDQKFDVQANVEIGFAAEGVLSFATAKKADLILMGTKGTSNLERKLFGSISMKVAREASCPVLLIPPNVRYEGFKDILVMSEQTEASEMTKLIMKQLCNRFNAFAHIVHIEKEKSETFHLSELKVAANDKEPAFQAVEISSPSIVGAVNKYIEHYDIDLGVIITHHRNLLENLLHKSITKQMVMHTARPLLVFHLDT